MSEPKLRTEQLGEVSVRLGRYLHPRNLSVQFVGIEQYPGEVVARLSTNLDLPLLPRGHFYAKTWSENERLWEDALASSLFEDTGKRVPTGFVVAQVWRLVGDLEGCDAS